MSKIGEYFEAIFDDVVPHFEINRTSVDIPGYIGHKIKIRPVGHTGGNITDAFERAGKAVLGALMEMPTGIYEIVESEIISDRFSRLIPLEGLVVLRDSYGNGDFSEDGYCFRKDIDLAIEKSKAMREKEKGPHYQRMVDVLSGISRNQGDGGVEIRTGAIGKAVDMSPDFDYISRHKFS